MSNIKSILENLVSYPVGEFDDVYVQFKEGTSFNLLDYICFSKEANMTTITEDGTDDWYFVINGSYQLIYSKDPDSNSASRKLGEEYRKLCAQPKN